MSKDRKKANRIFENMSVGILAGILLLIFQQTRNSIQELPSVSFESPSSFFSSAGSILPNIVIIAVIFLFISFSAIYLILNNLTFKDS